MAADTKTPPPSQADELFLKPGPTRADPPLVLKANGQPVRAATDPSELGQRPSLAHLSGAPLISTHGRQPRFDIPQGKCIDIDLEDGIETFALGDAQFECARCPGEQQRWHTCFVEIGGEAVIEMQAFKVCRDCELETKGEITKVGRVDSLAEASTTARAFANQRKPRSKVRRRR